MQYERNKTHAEIAELYEKADKIKPLAEKNGEIYVTFEDASVINSINAMDQKGTGIQTRNRDGSIASSGKRVHAINPDYFFANRCMKKGKKLYVVSGHEPNGYRCIKEQQSGSTFIKTIPVYVVVRDEEGNLKIDNLTNTDEKTFIAEYTNILSNALMAEIMPLIVAYGDAQTQLDKMPI